MQKWNKSLLNLSALESAWFRKHAFAVFSEPICRLDCKLYGLPDFNHENPIVWQGLMQWVLLVSKCREEMTEIPGIDMFQSTLQKKRSNMSMMSIDPNYRFIRLSIVLRWTHVGFFLWDQLRRDHVDKYGFDGIRVDAARHINRKLNKHCDTPWVQNQY